MHIETTIETALTTIRGFYANASNTTLDFMTMTSAKRDSLMDCTIDIKPTYDVKMIGFNFNPNTKHIIVKYNKDGKAIAQNPMTKVMGHEFGHIDYLLEGKTDLNRKIIFDPTYNAIHNITREPERLYAYGAAASVLATSLYPMAGAGAIAALMSYPYRVMEHYADDVSHKLMPEISYLNTIDAFYETLTDNSFIETCLKTRRRLQRSPLGPFLLPLDIDHPSDYSRDKICQTIRPIYLAEKQRLGIPSLYI